MSSIRRVSALTAHIGFWLRTVSNHVSYAFAAKLAAHGVTVAEWVVLRSLHGNKPTAPSLVAAEIGMTRGAITKLADRLIAKSLVVRKSSPEDGRSQTLALTRRGTDLVPALADLADRNDAEFFGHLPADERKRLEALLKRLVERCQMTAMPLD
jgi:DNA-binding MarR family transcriptional regulator